MNEVKETGTGIKLAKGIALVVCLVAAFFIGKGLPQPTTQPNLQIGGGVSPSSFRDFTTNQTITVNTSTAVLSNNNGRIYAAIVNNSANTVYLNLGTASTTADDYTIRLNANGGSYEINIENMYTGPVYASSSAASSLLVFEK